MDVHKILKELYEERDAIDHAMMALERAAAGRGQRKRGRAPKWLVEAREKEAASEREAAAKGKGL